MLSVSPFHVLFIPSFKRKSFSPASEAVRTELDNLHLSIAKNFQPNEMDPLLGLANRLDLSDAREWEMRLYSRDTRLSGKQVSKIKFWHNL